ncbi:MAG TPA: hypothetical protein VJ911_08475 [Cryomorphaceae bacterium]|nr:hypothetical protein [Cryomorphaceae bacterium]
MKAIKITFIAAFFIATSFGVQAQDGPSNTKFGIETNHAEYRPDSSGASGTRADQMRVEAYNKDEVSFYAYFFSTIFRWRLF